MVAVKVCTACGESKPLDAFHRRAKSPDGFRPRCKECRKAESAENYAKNGVRIRAAAKAWHQDNPERAAGNIARYRATNKWRATREIWNRRTDKKARDRDYYRRTSEKKKADARARTALIRGVTVEHFLHADVFDRDEWKCGICGDVIDRDLRYPDPRSVSLDHIVPLAAGGAHTKANTQAAHLCCNMSKGASVA